MQTEISISDYFLFGVKVVIDKRFHGKLFAWVMNIDWVVVFGACKITITENIAT